jgi:hypothetical protein
MLAFMGQFVLTVLFLFAPILLWSGPLLYLANKLEQKGKSPPWVFICGVSGILIGLLWIVFAAAYLFKYPVILL